MTDTEDVQHYADAVMALIKEDRDIGQVPRDICSWHELDDGVDAGDHYRLAGCHRGPATRLACGTLSTKIPGIPSGGRMAADAEGFGSRGETPVARVTAGPARQHAGKGAKGSLLPDARGRRRARDWVALLGGIMTIEVSVPDDWTTGQALAVRQLLQHAMRNAQPVIALVRKDATPEQLHDIYRKIEAVIRESGLEVEQAPVS